jgi:tetratricopeptide (TPR) repeat protein
MAPTEPSAFAVLLRQHRAEARLTQEELAERAGVSQRAISDLERGVNRSPRYDTVRRLVQALELSGEAEVAFEQAAQRPGEAPTVGAGELPKGNFLGAAPASHLVGREVELARLLGALEAAGQGRGQMILLAGEPGIGKTRLGQETALHARRHGYLLAVGSCYESRQVVPYYPFLDVLTALSDAAPRRTGVEPAQRWPQLRMLLPDAIVEDVAGSAEGPHSQEILFRAVAALLQTLARAVPVAILLDDLHWADHASLDLLQHLARHTRTDRVFILGAYPQEEVSRQHPLQRALRALRHEHLMERLAIGPLAGDETATQIAAILGGDTISPDLSALIYRYTEGNPFFTDEVLRALIKRGDVYRQNGGWTCRDITQIDVPESIREAIQERLSRLSDEGQDLLRQASVLGQTFSFDVLAAMTDWTDDELERVLDEALRAGLIQETGRDQFGFNHALTQHALYLDLPARRRRRLHLAAGAALENLPEAGRREHSAELAWHFLAGDDPARALAYAVMAGERAEAVFAHGEAEQHFRTALELAREVGNQELEARALERLGYALWAMNRYAEAIDLLEEAARLAALRGDRDTEAHIVAIIGWVYRSRGTVTQAAARVRNLLASADSVQPSAPVGSLWVILSLLLFLQPKEDRGEAFAAAERAAAIARATGDDRLLAQAEGRRGLMLNAQGRLDEARTVLERVVPLAESMGDLLTLSLALRNLGVNQGLSGDVPAARAFGARALDVALELGNPIYVNFMGWTLSYEAFIGGEWRQARADAERTSIELQRMGAHRANLVASLALIDLYEGKSHDAREHLKEAGALVTDDTEPENRHWVEYVRAVHDLWQGRPQAAVDRLTPVARDEALTVNNAPFVFVALGDAYLALGDRDAATEMATLALKTSSRAYRWSTVEANRLLGDALACRGRWDEALWALEEALAESRRASLPLYEARALHAQGKGLSRQRERAAARQRLLEARAIFQDLGTEPLVERSRQAIDQLEASVPATPASDHCPSR